MFHLACRKKNRKIQQYKYLNIRKGIRKVRVRPEKVGGETEKLEYEERMSGKTENKGK